MYLSHFELTENPFQVSPDPNYFWIGQTHKKALAALNATIQQNCGLVLIEGDIGVGKTLLVNAFLEQQENDLIVAKVHDPDLEKFDFFNYIAAAFEIRKRFESKGDFYVHFLHFLHKSYARGKKVLLIIDEAQRASRELLEELTRLSRLKHPGGNLLNIFLIEQTDWVRKSRRAKNKAFFEIVSTHCRIDPLKKTDVKHYIQFRLSVAGREKPIFRPDAVRAVAKMSRCCPRIINQICDHALLRTYLRGKQEIDARLIEDTATELRISEMFE